MIQIVIIYGRVTLGIIVGIRQTCGLLLGPMALDHGWYLGDLALASAVQNLVRGLAQPAAELAAGRYAAKYVLSAGAGIYALGVLLMVVGQGESIYELGAGVFIGLGVSAAAFLAVLGEVGRLVLSVGHSLFGLVSAVVHQGGLLCRGRANIWEVAAALALVAGPQPPDQQWSPSADCGGEGCTIDYSSKRRLK